MWLRFECEIFPEDYTSSPTQCCQFLMLHPLRDNKHTWHCWSNWHLFVSWKESISFSKAGEGRKREKNMDWAASWCLILELAEYTCVWRLLFTVNKALCGSQSKVLWTSREMSLRHGQSLQRPATSLLSVQLSQQTLIFWKEQVSFHTSYWCVSQLHTESEAITKGREKKKSPIALLNYISC